LGSGRERGYLEDDAALSRVAFGGRKGAATKILENMSYRQRVFVEMKYGFRGEEHTLSDIADILPRINSWGSFWFGVSGVHRVAPWGVSVLPLHTSLSVCN
ncbi:MAG: hypothetical protein KGI27_14045, partial [Thaumarchaeota archaeon]|nr:hypothetical protein [Nitrososphaerota archaeon]